MKILVALSAVLLVSAWGVSPALALSCARTDYVVPGHAPPETTGRARAADIPPDMIAFVGRMELTEPIEARPSDDAAKTAEDRYYMVTLTVEKNLRHAAKSHIKVLLNVGPTWPNKAHSNAQADAAVRRLKSDKSFVFLVPRPSTARDNPDAKVIEKHRPDGVAAIVMCEFGIMRHETNAPWGEYYVRALTSSPVKPSPPPKGTTLKSKSP